MKRCFAFLLISILFENGIAQDNDVFKRSDCQILLNESYGEFDRNKFDIIIPDNDTPVPLVIYIHGGGFLFGDKNGFYQRKEDIQYFLEKHMAIATINYRFYKSDDSLGVRICIQDVQRALQYIRHHASKYHIDQSRIGCYGISAGAGSSLYLAFHDDMAIPGDTSLLGESTRIKSAGALYTQSTYNLFAWKNIIPWFPLVFALKHKQFYKAAANFYGYKDYKSFKKYKEQTVKSLDMLSMIDSHDPPVYLMNLTKETFPKNDNIIQHHNSHALKVSGLLNKNGVKNYCYTYKKHQIEKEQDISYPVREFLAEQLTL